MIKNYKKLKIDFYANTVPHPCKFPDGSDIEIFGFKTLKNAFENSSLPSEREHVTFYMWKTNKFKIKKYNEKKTFQNIDIQLIILMILN